MLILSQKKAIKCLNAFEDNINTYKIHATQCVTGSFFLLPNSRTEPRLHISVRNKKAATLDMTEIFSRDPSMSFYPDFILILP